MLEQATVRQYYHYDPVEGVLMRKDVRDPQPIISTYASLKNRTYTTARIIYCFMMGDDIPKTVLRIDKNPANNKWNNFTTSIYNSNRFGVQKKLRPSAQKRPVQLNKEVIRHAFRLDPVTNELFLRSKDGSRETLLPKSMLVIPFRGNNYARTYIVRWCKRFLENWDDPNYIVSPLARKPVIPPTPPKIERNEYSLTSELDVEFSEIFKPVV